MVGGEIAGVVQVQVFPHVFVQVIGLDFAAEGVCVCKQQGASVPVFGSQVFVVKLVHYEFGDFQNGKYDGDGLVQFHFLSRCAHHHQIGVHNLALPKRDLADCF